MQKQNAPIKSTSGEGFSFEDKVVAFFLCHLLSGTVPFGPELGRLVRLDCQVRSQGWELDDLLLTFNTSGQHSCCALSIRSSRQFTRASAPADLVNAAWAQLLHARSQVFDSNHDFVGILTAIHSPEVRENLNTLLKLARGQEPSALQAHVTSGGTVSTETVRLHDSFKCPSELATPEVAQAPGTLLRRLLFREFDFAEAVSERESTALSLCEQTLVNGNLNDARSLWETLLAVANRTRTEGGFLDLPRMLGTLRNRFALKAHPDFEPDWRTTNERTRHYLELVDGRLGGTLHVSRPAELQRLNEQLQKHNVILVRGTSGSGKSALFKAWIEQQPIGEMRVVWVRAEDLQRYSDKPLTGAWGLRWPLGQFLASSPARLSVLVIDGLENCYSREAYQNVKDLVVACALGTTGSPWKIAFTCQIEEWPRVQTNLLHFVNSEFGKLPEVPVENFTSEQFEEVATAFPSLRPLGWRKEIARLLLRPKILDLLVTQIKARAAVIETAKWVGEADLIEWWWEDVVEQTQPTSERGRVLRFLAEKLSDKLENELSMDEFRGDEAICSALAHDGVCRVIEGRLRFAHDLFADWARQRQLLAQGSNLKSYLAPRLEGPPWQKALRLVGLHLVERRGDLTDWRRLLAEFTDDIHTSKLARDLLLEATVFASDPGPLLEKLWPELAAKDGELLRRFLKRFLHSATIPDYRSVEFFQKAQPNLVTEIAARHRLPYVPYWIPVLRWLHDHMAEATTLSREEVARIAKSWLTIADGQWLDRKLAAELAVRNAENIVPLEFSRHSRLDDDEAKTIYDAALAAAGDIPERVAKLALTLSGRKALRTDEIPADADAHALGKESELSGQVFHSELADDPPQPWPDGPRRPVSRAFQETFLQGGSAVPLIVHQPTVAAEVTLALLVSWPCTRIIRSGFGPGVLEEAYGFQFLHPDDSFYTAGPFLLFLRYQPEHAISLILKLVNFATERCIDLHFGGDAVHASVQIPFESGGRCWLGDWRVFFWFRYPLITVHIIGAALMALEKWLYECLDAGRSVESEIELILAGSRSVALAGVLLCVGKRKPELLTGPLRELLAVREFHLGDTTKSVQYRGINAAGFEFGDSGIRRRLKLEWEQMPHRDTALHDLCCRIFLTKPETHPVFGRIHRVWIDRATEYTANSEEALSWLRWAAKFKLDNYTKKESNGQTVWEFILPEDLRDKGAEEQMQGEQLVMQLPFWCRMVLDQRKPLPEGQLDSLWKTLQDLDRRPPPSEGDKDMRAQFFHPAHSVAGLIAVLVTHHREWLTRHPEREKWCREKISALLRAPPQLMSFDPHDSVDCCLDGFAAQVVPIFWADEPNSGIWREHVVSLALCPRLKTVALLCHAAAVQRSRLGEAFQDLQTFLLHLSVARLKERRQQYSDKKEFDWPGWVRDWAMRFVSRAIPPPPKSWLDIAAPDDRKRNRRGPRGRDVPRRDVDLDLDFLLTAFSWVGRIEDAATHAERGAWIQFEREALSCVLRTFPGDIGKDQEYGGTPYQTDRHVFDRIAALLLQLRANEHPEDFWKPILNLGTAARYWVNGFLNSFFSAGLQQTPASPVFIETWKSMLDYAFASPEWTVGRLFRLGELWHHLLGQDWVVRSLWTKEHEALLVEMKPYFERWAKERLDDEHELRNFFHFLETEAAGCLVCAALAWISPLLRNANEWFWNREEDRDAFASFLGFVWDKHWVSVKRNSAALGGFKTLAAKLASYQNPLALEISSRVAGAP